MTCTFCYDRGFNRIPCGGTRVCEVCKPMRVGWALGVDFTPVADVRRHTVYPRALELYFPRRPSDEDMHRIRALLREVPAAGNAANALKPLDLILHCPTCSFQHVDAPEPEIGWLNEPHTTHKCKACGEHWRPADITTNGVAAIKTRGSSDTWPRINEITP